jgi:hypothetical protein
LCDRSAGRVHNGLSIRRDLCHEGPVAMDNETDPTLDPDAYLLMVERAEAEGKLAPEDIATLRAIAQQLLAVREELRASDASMERVRGLMCGVR